MRKIAIILGFIVLFGSCGGSTEIAGISDEGGCGPFDIDFELAEFVQVIRNDCPFVLTFRFVVEQDGCKLTLENAGPSGEDIPGVLNSAGFYGIEIKGTDGTIYECQGDAVEDSIRGTDRMDCQFNTSLCRVEFDQI